NALQLLFGGDAEAVVVATGQQFRLSIMATRPHGANRVDHVLCRQVSACRDNGLSCITAALPCPDLPALLQNCGPARPMDGAVHTAAAQQAAVRGIHYRVYFDFRDIALLYFYFCVCHICFFSITENTRQRRRNYWPHLRVHPKHFLLIS